MDANACVLHSPRGPLRLKLFRYYADKGADYLEVTVAKSQVVDGHRCSHSSIIRAWLYIDARGRDMAKQRHRTAGSARYTVAASCWSGPGYLARPRAAIFEAAKQANPLAGERVRTQLENLFDSVCLPDNLHEEVKRRKGKMCSMSSGHHC